MKKVYLILSLLLIFGACKKQTSSPTDVPVCVERVYPDFSNQIDSAMMDSVRLLFKQNNLSLNNLQAVKAIDLPGYYKMMHVDFNQIISGLPYFDGDISYHFYLDSLALSQGLTYMVSGTNVTNIKMDSVYRIPIGIAAKILYQQIKKDNLYKNIYPSANWKDSCYEVTLGVSAIMPNPNKYEYLLSWKITVNNRNYPVCYVNAKNGVMLGYNDGIIIF